MEESETIIKIAKFQRLYREIAHKRRLLIRDKGLVPPDVFLMMEIGKDASASVLSEHFNVTIPAIMHKLDSLEKKGYVSRAVCDKDRRKKSVILTEKAYALLHETKQIMIEQTRDMFQHLGEKDSDELLRIMERIVECK